MAGRFNIVINIFQTYHLILKICFTLIDLVIFAPLLVCLMVLAGALGHSGWQADLTSPHLSNLIIEAK